jgi:hypothetical protein
MIKTLSYSLAFAWCCLATPAVAADSLQDTALNKLIVEQVLLQYRSPQETLVILTPNKNWDMIAYLESRKDVFSLFYDYLASAFSSGTKSLKTIASQQTYTIDSSINQQYKGIIWSDGSKAHTYTDLKKLSTDNNWAPVVTSLLILADQDKGKCLIYYHQFEGGDAMAFLERKNNRWELIKSENMTLE